MEADQEQRLSVPWTSRDVWWGLAGMGLWLALALGAMALIRSLGWDLDPGLSVTLLELLLLLPVWWLTVRRYGVGWQALGLRGFGSRALGVGCGLMIGSWLFNLVYSLGLSQFGLQMQDDIIPILSELSAPWLFAIGAVAVAPLVEELFFRGFVFAGLRGRYGWRTAALISAGLFAVVHLQPTAILPIFVLGLIFAYLYERSGSIWPAVLMHVSSNALALGAAYLAIQMGLST
ncbi:MAG: CPBP family intramembrane metalloprotease [Anaerolineae bacterium]|nr:CPBP family intramembrane metalloprotease [Anaerolineae bacterium]